MIKKCPLMFLIYFIEFNWLFSHGILHTDSDDLIYISSISVLQFTAELTERLVEDVVSESSLSVLTN